MTWIHNEFGECIPLDAVNVWMIILPRLENDMKAATTWFGYRLVSVCEKKSTAM
jgi:hypothetical protein